MSFAISDVQLDDAASIARHVQVPAMQSGPLYRIMFPQYKTMTGSQIDEVIHWNTETLEKTIKDDSERFLKVCNVDGIPVGFCGWHVINKAPQPKPEQHVQTEMKNWTPSTIDMDGWNAVSEALRTEREHVLTDLDNICARSFCRP